MDDHQQHERRLAAALGDLVGQIDISDYRDSKGHPARNNLAFLKAQAIVDEFGLTHEQLCRTLDDCGDDLTEAASRIFALRGASAAKPGTVKIVQGHPTGSEPGLYRGGEDGSPKPDGRSAAAIRDASAGLRGSS